MQKRDSIDSSSSMKKDYHTQHYYSEASSSGTRFGSVIVPSKTSVYLNRASSSSFSSNEENNQSIRESLTFPSLQYDQLMNQYRYCCAYLEDWSKQVDVLSQENAALQLVNQYLIKQLDLPTDISVNHEKNQSSDYISSKLPSVSTNKDSGIEDNGGSGGGGPNSNTNRVIPSLEAPVTTPTSVFDEEYGQITAENLRYEKLMGRFRLCCGYLDDLAKQVDVLSQEKATLLSVNENLISQLTQSTVNRRSAYVSSGFPSLSVVSSFFTHSTGDNGGSTGDGSNSENNSRIIPSREAPVTSPASEKLESVGLPENINPPFLLIRLGHGSTGLAFMNPEMIIMAADGFETGIEYWVGPDNVRHDVQYEIFDSEKVFSLGEGPNRIIAVCAGSTWWYRDRIIPMLRERIQSGENLSIEECAHFSRDYMLTDPPDENLAAGVDIHQEHAEILFGGFIDATGDITRPVNQWPSSPSLFYADHLEFYEINSSTREFPQEELEIREYWNLCTIGSGKGSALGILDACEEFLVMEKASWRSQYLRALFAMQEAIIEDEDTDGRVSISMITRTGGYRHDHYESETLGEVGF